MSAAISCSTGRPYGVARVCSAWGVSRSSHYARKVRRMHPALLAKRGPIPLLGDKEGVASAYPRRSGQLPVHR